MKIFKQPLFFAALAVFAVGFALLAGFQLDINAPELLSGLAFAGVGDINDVSKKIEGIEASLTKFQEQAKLEIENTGKVSTETKNALDKLAEQQLDVANRLLAIEQKSGTPAGQQADNSWGKQFTNSDSYKSYIGGNTSKARFEVQNNTVLTTGASISADRKAFVPGAFQPLTLESLLPSAPTSSNAVEYVRELLWTNNAAETAEGAAKPESSITFELKTMPVSTIAHWIKISKQLAADAPALAAYINNRMVYGVDHKVERQLAIGDGTSPNISGLFDTGNFTPHGIADAALTPFTANVHLKKFVLIRKIIAAMWASGYTAEAILLNASDWADMELALLTVSSNIIRIGTDSMGVTRIWGIPVIQSIGIAADTFLVGAFQQGCTKHERQGVVVDMSESDSDNFTKNLITVRAERRLALTVEVPAAIVGGDLTPV